ncbi:aldehyde reductase [Xylariaceae sp. FL0255]|nr:aldehyde reductase [Xylariaceae sp. FL0255]
MSQASQSVIPKGSTVLVTGANGFIGSHVADQFLKHEFRVRGTARSSEKLQWLVNLFNRKYGEEKFEAAVVADMSGDGAFNQVVKGVSAVIHTAASFTMNPNPHDVIPGMIKGTMEALEAASEEPSVKRFVLTSSSSAALIPKPNDPVTVTVDTWNDSTVQIAYRDPPYEPERAYPVYAAGKTLAEKEAWIFMREKKPGFEMNTVLPNLTLGASLDPINQGHPSTSGFLAALFKGDTSYLAFLPPQYFVDVEDVGLLHVAAATLPHVISERIFAFAEPQNGNDILAALRRLYPDRSFPADFQAGKDLSDIVPRQRAEALLREMGKDGWTKLEESIKRNTSDLI